MHRLRGNKLTAGRLTTNDSHAGYPHALFILFAQLASLPAVATHVATLSTWSLLRYLYCDYVATVRFKLYSRQLSRRCSFREEFSRIFLAV